ncbi:MAG: NADH:ubiquinone oxidoreductase, partial [Solirubrobacteraceae bacterium]
MLGWLVRGLRQGRITTRYPHAPETAPAGYKGRVAVLDSRGAPPELAQLCPTGAIAVDAGGRVTLDRGRCILCGECVLAAPRRFAFEPRYETAARSRSALVVSETGSTPAGEPLREPL